VEVPIYDFTTHTRTADTVSVTPRRAVILEGMLVLADPDLRDLMDIEVFVDTVGVDMLITKIRAIARSD
jgi:uridine kinase